MVLLGTDYVTVHPLLCDRRYHIPTNLFKFAYCFACEFVAWLIASHGVVAEHGQLVGTTVFPSDHRTTGYNPKAGQQTFTLGLLCLLVRDPSLIACILMHSTSNLLLGSRTNKPRFTCSGCQFIALHLLWVPIYCFALGTQIALHVKL